MERGRTFAHIYEISSLEVQAYLLPGTDSLVQSHLLGISKIARIGSYVIINSGGTKLVGIVTSLHVTEPEKLYWIRTKPDYPDRQVIRTVSITLVGQFYQRPQGGSIFERGINSYPSIDEEVMAPTQEELDLILSEETKHPKQMLEVGLSYPTNDIRIRLDPVRLFSRHCAVVGSTGNGKSCTVTVILNELLAKGIDMPAFVFDINGEYAEAFKTFPGTRIWKFVGKIRADYPRHDKVVAEELKLNYSSFSRQTLRAILKPSEKTQIPALNFAFDARPYLSLCLDEVTVQDHLKAQIPQHLRNQHDKRFSSFLCGDPSETDQQKLKMAYDTLRFLAVATATEMPRNMECGIRMSVLANFIADRWGIFPRQNALSYDGFRYGNVAGLCDRIVELCRDRLFCSFCDTSGSTGIDLNATTEAGEHRVTVFDLSMIPQEFISVVVDAMLEQHLLRALEGRFLKRPHLLVLDEAHHYMGNRNTGDGGESVYLSNPPGERIAKEGRKYGLHLLVSSQRPREISATIIAQIGTVISHALTHVADREVVSGFGTYNDRTVLDALSVLPRREVIILGKAISMPTRFKVSFLPEECRPSSQDPLEEVIHGESEGTVKEPTE